MLKRAVCVGKWWIHVIFNGIFMENCGFMGFSMGCYGKLVISWDF
jgi:hypothetical protein